MADTTEERLARIEEKLDRLLALGAGLADEAMEARDDITSLRRAVDQHDHKLGLVPCLRGVPGGPNGTSPQCKNGGQSGDI